MTGLINQKERKDEIIKLWHNCFNDSEDYIGFFLENCENTCIGTVIDNHLVSMLFLLDGNMKEFRLKYIYAACTDEKYRGRGLMGDLIGYTVDYCRDNDFDGIFLVPAEESLYSYYSQFGFLEGFKRYDAELPFSFEAFKEWKLINEDTALEVRKELLKEFICFTFSDSVQKYSFSEHIFSDGKILLYPDRNNLTLAFLCKNEKNFFLKEFLSKNPVEMLKKSVQTVNNSEENIYIRFPIVYNITDIGAVGTKCGMCLPLSRKFREYYSCSDNYYAGMYLD